MSDELLNRAARLLRVGFSAWRGLTLQGSFQQRFQSGPDSTQSSHTVSWVQLYIWRSCRTIMSGQWGGRPRPQQTGGFCPTTLALAVEDTHLVAGITGAGHLRCRNGFFNRGQIGAGQAEMKGR